MSVVFCFFVGFFCLFFLFEKESERTWEHARGGGVEREGERKQTGSMPSREPNAGLDPKTMKS